MAAEKLINWVYYPRSMRPPDLAVGVVSAFNDAADKISSDSHELSSNQVLAAIAPGLLKAGFRVEAGKGRSEKISVPVLFGPGGRPEKSFDADAFNEAEGLVVEVEAGRGVLNYGFLKDLFEACMMHSVKYLAIAVRNRYKKVEDFEQVTRFFETLYTSNRLRLPLEGVLIIGY
jgi:hypothetical protein